MQYKQKTRFDDRFAKIAAMGQIFFHTNDLANLWRIENENTLHATLSRYVKKGLLFRAHKGLYAIKPIDKIDPIMLGIKALRRFAYASTETVLAHSGIIQQETREITLISSISKRFSIGRYHYRSRKMNDQYLHNTLGIIAKNGYKIATVPRATADMLYFNRRAHFDGKNAIDWNQVKIIQKQVYDSAK